MEAVASKIVVSLVGSAIVGSLSYAFRTAIMNTLLVILSRLTRIGIDRRYDGDEEARKDMIRAAERSKRVRLLSMRAFRLLRDNAALACLLDDAMVAKEIRLLLADPTSDAVHARAVEYTKIDKRYTESRYRWDIIFSVKQVGGNIKNQKIKLRMHCEPAFIRLLITDEFAFVSFFPQNQSGDDSCVFRVCMNSKFYEAFRRYFDWLWENRSEAFDAKKFEC